MITFIAKDPSAQNFIEKLTYFSLAVSILSRQDISRDN